MSSIRGRIHNGVVVFETPLSLPEGTEVVVSPLNGTDNRPLGEALISFSGIVKGGPTDIARNHDHYLSLVARS